MSQKTYVKRIRLKPSVRRLYEHPSAQLIELAQKERRLGNKFLQLDHLIRNISVVASLTLMLIAVKNSSAPETQSVFNAIQESTGIQWDESIGKLSFVNSIFPEELQEVWNEKSTVYYSVPGDGATLHNWSQQEPYTLFECVDRNVYAAMDGEVIGIAHGLNDERIIRILHENEETVYGNLKECFAAEGDLVRKNEKIGTVLQNMPLVFELRYAGRSVKPTFELDKFPE